jgi:DNA-binding response OmpR family regulator
MRAHSWFNFLNGLKDVTGALWRRWDHWENRTVLAVTKDKRCEMRLRTLSLEQGWRILFAGSLDEGIHLQAWDRVCVLVYDQHLPGVEWRKGLRTLLALDDPILAIIISDVPSARLRSEVLNCGGYDLARKPLEPQWFVALVNGALALAESIDSMEFADPVVRKKSVG